MSLTAGTQLGTFEILALLGKGGMGEVYRARDSRLKREVAIKVLPDEFSRDHERVSRFQREAEVLASLNHPNIGGIHDLQEAGSSRFLVLELVEGETLAERIARGPVPIDEALQIAKQICEALEAAHEKGITHRDLKPANIKVTPDGKVKVLDFGLAKAFQEQQETDLSNSPTMMSAASVPGIIWGTAAYMSPEQAKGRTVDKRTDIFAFGGVLYEMLTGKRAFDGDDVSEILAHVITSEPAWNLLPSNVRPRIRELLRLCLEKNPKKRLRDAGDILIQIEQAAKEPDSVSSITTPLIPFRKRTIPVVLAVIFTAAIVAAAVWNIRPPSSPPIVTRFAFTLGEGQQFTNAGRDLVAISPDGTQIVYSANNRIYLRRMGELEAKVIPGSENVGAIWNPVFSPDGGSIAFLSDLGKTLKRIAVNGGAAISLCQNDAPVYGLNWSEDGIQFVLQRVAIIRVSQNGGKPETLVALKSDEAATDPQLLPGGKSLLFSLITGATGATPDWDQAKVVVQTIGSTERKVLIEGGSEAHYLPTGHIVYALSGTLRAVPFDLKKLEVTGGPVPVVEGVRRDYLSGGTAIANFSFSSNGSLVYVPGPVSLSGNDLALIDREGHAEPLKLQPGTYLAPRVSPDGKQVAFQTDDGKDSILWIYDLSGRTSMRRLTFGGKNRFPVWSPDSKWVAFQSDREGDVAIFRQRADGSGTAERLTKPDADTSHLPDSWSPDGNTLLFEVRKGSAAASLWALSVRDKKATAFGNIENINPIDAIFPPDGRWVAYNSGETGTNEIFVQPFPATGAKYQISKSPGSHAPRWSPDGRELFYTSGLVFVAVRITIQPSFAVGKADDVFKRAVTYRPRSSRNYDIMPDGQHIIDVVPAGQDATSSASAPQIQVILNWFEDLKQRVPVPR